MAATWITTRELPLATLTRYPGNARRGNTTQIRASIRRNGQYRALVVRHHHDSYTILAGNHTADALTAEGHATARCEIIECTDSEAARINLADNRLAELGSYDDDALAALLAQLDGDYEGTGWDDETATALAAEPDPPPDSADLPAGQDGYREQYGVIVMCPTEADQQAAYEDLLAHGYQCRVVTT